jgi:hypothetical protein
LPDVFELFKYWKQQPPVHEMVASYFGLSYTPNNIFVAPDGRKYAASTESFGELCRTSGVAQGLPPAIESNPHLKEIYLKNKQKRVEARNKAIFVRPGQHP